MRVSNENLYVSPEVAEVEASARRLEEADAVSVLLPEATDDGALLARDGWYSVASMLEEFVSKAQGSSVSVADPIAAGLTRTQTTTLLAEPPAIAAPPSSLSESGRSRTGLLLPVGVAGPTSSRVSSPHSDVDTLLEMETSASIVDEDERGVGLLFVVILAAASAPLLVGRAMPSAMSL